MSDGYPPCNDEEKRLAFIDSLRVASGRRMIAHKASGLPHSSRQMPSSVFDRFNRVIEAMAS
jgi:flagellar biosynthesis/type III secretory pathway ATPase